MLFFAERKERKETANVAFDRLCGRQWFDGGYKRRHPRSLRSRDPSITAIFVDIAPEGAHAARALRLRARASQRQLLPARRMLACRAKREQTTVGSRGYALPSRRLRVRDGSLGDSFRRFLVGEKTTYSSPLIKEKRVLFFPQRKERKEAANVPFDRLCELKTHLVGSHTKNPSNLYPFRFLCYSLLSVLCIFKKIQGNDTCLHS